MPVTEYKDVPHGILSDGLFYVIGIGVPHDLDESRETPDLLPLKSACSLPKNTGQALRPNPGVAIGKTIWPPDG